MADKVKLEVECPPCGGTGIYHSYAEPEGVGVVCRDCRGEGKTTIEYTPFTGRKPAVGIETVYATSRIFTNIGPVGESVSYEAFLAGERPPYPESDN